MRHGATFHVMKFAPPYGRPDQARRVTVAHHAYTLAEALAWARAWLKDVDRRPLWIARRDRPAHRQHAHRRR